MMEDGERSRQIELEYRSADAYAWGGTPEFYGSVEAAVTRLDESFDLVKSEGIKRLNRRQRPAGSNLKMNDVGVLP